MSVVYLFHNKRVLITLEHFNLVHSVQSTSSEVPCSYHIDFCVPFVLHSESRCLLLVSDFELCKVDSKKGFLLIIIMSHMVP